MEEAIPYQLKPKNIITRKPPLEKTVSPLNNFSYNEIKSRTILRNKQNQKYKEFRFVESKVWLTIELGCSYKEDLAATHKHCAETFYQNTLKATKTQLNAYPCQSHR